VSEGGLPLPETRCGSVAVIGAPNAGKSTLVNRLVGEKVTIVSPKVQTTRALVRGIATRGDAQVIFVDTPGIFAPRKKLERAMVSAAWQGHAETDLVLIVIDASRRGVDRDTRTLIKRAGEALSGRPCLLALNKIDKIPREKLLALAAELNALLPFAATFMISALKGDGTDRLLDWLAAHLPQSEWVFPEDQVSDMPMRLLAAEIVREQLFLKLYRELPYELTVETEEWENFRDGSARVSCVIYVTREGHRRIILGKGGEGIREIGARARHELQALLEMRLHLSLYVKVKEGWSEDPERYRPWGLDSGA
jgi:GTP-binding protein Era